MRMENLKILLTFGIILIVPVVLMPVLYWIINTDCGLLSFQTEEFLILT